MRIWVARSRGFWVKPESRGAEYTFFAGCLARLKLPQVERSVRFALTDLGLVLHDEPRFTCCPDPVVFRSSSRGDWLTLAARNLSLDSVRPIVTLCPGCASSLSEARHLLKHDGKARETVERSLSRESMELSLPEVSHFLKVLAEADLMGRLRDRISRKLDGLRVACHYGCHLVRPSAAVGFDDPEKPTSLEALTALLGAEPVDYEDKYMCCGRPSMDEKTSMEIAGHKLASMKAAGCDLIALACPFCFEQFDLGQAVLARKTGQDFGIPVVYVTQLMGVAMGRRPEEMGFDLHRVSLKDLL
jgi:heterodisulfide reductase subunit B